MPEQQVVVVSFLARVADRRSAARRVKELGKILATASPSWQHLLMNAVPRRHMWRFPSFFSLWSLWALKLHLCFCMLWIWCFSWNILKPWMEACLADLQGTFGRSGWAVERGSEGCGMLSCWKTVLLCFASDCHCHVFWCGFSFLKYTSTCSYCLHVLILSEFCRPQVLSFCSIHLRLDSPRSSKLFKTKCSLHFNKVDSRLLENRFQTSWWISIVQNGQDLWAIYYDLLWLYDWSVPYYDLLCLPWDSDTPCRAFPSRSSDLICPAWLCRLWAQKAQLVAPFDQHIWSQAIQAESEVKPFVQGLKVTIYIYIDTHTYYTQVTSKASNGPPLLVCWFFLPTSFNFVGGGIAF